MSDVGRMLREGRKARGLEISDVARRTCIRAYYLRAMEEGRFQVLPKVFDVGYLKAYAKLLDIDAQTLLLMYEKEKSRARA